MDGVRIRKCSEMFDGHEATSLEVPASSTSSSSTSDVKAIKTADKEGHIRSKSHVSYGQELLSGSKVFAFNYSANAYCPGVICGTDANGRHLVEFCGDGKRRPAPLNGIVPVTRLHEGLKAFVVTNDEANAAREIVLGATPEFANTEDCLLEVVEHEQDSRFSVPWTSLRFTKKELSALLVDMASPGINEVNILSGRRSKRPRISDFPFITDEHEVANNRSGGVKRSRGGQRRYNASQKLRAKSPGVSTNANSDKKHKAFKTGNAAVDVSQMLPPCNTTEKPAELDEDHDHEEPQEVSVLKVVPVSRQSHDSDPHQQQTVHCYGKVTRQSDDRSIYYESQQYPGHVFKFAHVETFERKDYTRRHYGCADCLQLYEAKATTRPPVIIVTVNDNVVERDPDAPLGIPHSCRQGPSSTFPMYTLP